jgi:predicted O-methyltransferase YrrM
MNSVLQEILDTGRVKSESGELREVRFGVSQKEGEFLQGLIRELRPVVSLEIGMAYGVSTLYICDALEKTPYTRHIVIDPNQYGQALDGIGMSNLRRAGHGEIIELLNEPSHQALPRLEAEGLKIDFAFIDGWHTFDYTLIDFFYIDRLLKVGGVVALDDTNMPGIRKLCRYIATNRAYRVTGLAPTSSYRISWRRRLLDQMLRFRKLSREMGRILSAEITHSDLELGLVGSCIAFQKDAEDTRDWDFHAPF